MRNRAIAVALLLGAAGSLPAQLPPGLDTAALRRHVATLASDRFLGRGPGAAGEDSTVAYLVRQFRALGLQPGNPDGTYIQRVPLVGLTTRAQRLELVAAGQPLPLRIPEDMVVVSRRVQARIDVLQAPLVFVGYGVVAPEYGWDDYKGLDVRGKTLVMLVNDPPVPDPRDPARLDSTVFGGRAMTYYGRWTYKYEIASQKGAAAVLLVHETGPAGYPWEVVVNSWGGENFDIDPPDGNRGRVALEAWITRDAAVRLFQRLGLDFDSLKRAAARRDFRPVPLDARLDASLTNTIRRVASRNVAALLPGRDPQRRREVLVVTAHWDHLGVGRPVDGDSIYNGAVDNATGTAGLLLLADAFRRGPRPARSVLFLAVTAEERGLLGAKWYATHPLVPLARTVANLNMDGLNVWGRTRDVVVVGWGQSTLEDVLRAEAARQGRVLRPDPEPEKGFYYRSDHFEFAKVGVPALYLDDGIEYLGKPPGYGEAKRREYTERRYHKPQDEVLPEWDLGGAVEALALLYRVGWRVANEPRWPQWKPGSEFRKLRPVAPLPPVGRADLVLRGGRVLTLEPSQPEAEAVAIAGGRIAAVGSAADVAPWIGPGTRVIDLRGRVAMPGFIEGHGHFLGLGRSRTILDLSDARSWEEIVRRVAAEARRRPPGTWIFGRGWHQEKWTRTPPGAVDGVPRHDALSAVTPRHPVLLTHASGHAAFANAEALRRAGIDRTTADPPGGTVVRDARGEPTGLLREAAQRLVQAAYEREQAARPAAERAAEIERWARLAGEEAVRHGVTSFHDAGVDFASLQVLRRLAEAGRLPVRLYAMVRGEPIERLERDLPRYRWIDVGDGFLTVRALKFQLDGALGSHGAWLLEPYADRPNSTGLVLDSLPLLERAAELAARTGFQMAVHAIGDRANREILDLYERVFARHPEARALRWRVEHAQHLDPADVPRFARLGVLASVQCNHATSDAPWVARRLGPERAARTSYPWRSLLDSGARLNVGTDVPVEPIDPIANFVACVTRRSADGTVFLPEQRMTRQEALIAYTLGNAYAAFQESELGSIAPGKRADLVILSQDPLRAPEDRLATTRVEMTIVGGRVRYERSGPRRAAPGLRR